MFQLVLKIDREVTPEEVEEFSKFSRLLKKGDIFVLKPLTPAMTPEKTQEVVPEPPSQPVIIPSQPRKHRPWGEIVGSAFAKTLNSHPKNEADIEVLRTALAWSECDRSDWVPYKKASLGEVIGIADNALAYTLVYTVLKFMGRQPVSTAREVLLPPTMMTWTLRKEHEQREQEEANLKLTGDAHIGFPLHEKKTMAVTPPEILYEKLAALDWSSNARRPMTVRQFMESVGIPFTRGNAVRLGIVAREEFGGLEKVKQTKEGFVFGFPPMKKA